MVNPGQHKEVFLGTASFKGVGKHLHLRCSSRYNYFWQSLNGEVFHHIGQHNTTPLGDLIIPHEFQKVLKGETEEDVILVELQDILGGLGIKRSETLVDHVNSDKIDITEADIVYCKLDPERGKFFIPKLDSQNRMVGSTEFVPIKLNQQMVTAKFLQRVLLLPEVKATLGLIKSGKCQARTDLEEFKRLEIPLPILSEQVAFIERTEHLWEKIESLLDEILSFTEIIDKGLADYLGEHILEPPVITTINSKLISKSKLVRFGQRFLSMSLEFDKILRRTGKSVPLSSLVTACGGKRLPKGTLYETRPTSYRYLRGGDVKDGRVLNDQMVYISEDAYDAITRYTLKENDIILTIAGTIGKVGMANNVGLVGVTENVAVIRPHDSNETLPEFILYLFMSSFMQFQMRKEMSELRQQKLSLEKLRVLRVPQPPDREEQTHLVNLIREQFDHNHSLIEEVNKIKKDLDNQLRDFLGVITYQTDTDYLDVELVEDDALDEDSEETDEE